MLGARRLARTLAVSLLLAISITLAASSAMAGPRTQRFRDEMLRLVNQTRTVQGERPLRLNRTLSRVAWRHSVEMGRRSRLFHTANLANVVQPFDVRTWGENLAYASTLKRVEQLWVGSPEHRTNLLNPAFRWAGIGVVKVRGWLWVTLQLYG